MTTSHTLQQMGMGLLGLALFAGGCATATDVRGTARLESPGPALLVTGPVEILHVNVDQKAAARFSRVVGANQDCRFGQPLAWNGESDLKLHAGESVCVEVQHRTRVSWHARPLPASFAPQVQASR
jgi:hypothetical protein